MASGFGLGLGATAYPGTTSSTPPTRQNSVVRTITKQTLKSHNDIVLVCPQILRISDFRVYFVTVRTALF